MVRLFKRQHLCLCLFAAIVGFAMVDAGAQEPTQKPTQKPEPSVDEKRSEAQAVTADKKNTKSVAPMVKDATISLQTTITGNQEQPKVMYILPWQSPQTDDVDFESIENQQKAVFEHVERDELRRALATQTESEKTKP